MQVRTPLRPWKMAATLGLSVWMLGCGDDADPDISGLNGMRDTGVGAVQTPDASSSIPGAPTDAGGANADAGSVPVIKDAGATSVDAATEGGAKDASVAPEAGSGADASQDGSTPGSSGDGGVKTDASTPGPTEGCLMFVEEDDPALLEVNGGVSVKGVGCKQQWEGIVMTQGGRGLCTAAFISDRHLISASHCYASDGSVSLKVSAPTWDNGMSHTFQATVKRSGSSMTLDISVIDLGKPVEWATPERRFVLHAGKTTGPVDMHLYGFGSGGSSGGAGTLRAVPNNATIRVTDNGRGNLTGKAGPAQLCTGDSGGPAFVEKTAPVLYGINQAIVPSGTGGGRTCASTDWSIMFTNVSKYMSFIEMALGKQCERQRVDDLDVAKCG
ncbi:MAG TPA: trypsin-like serine protease [Polyangiaceae bacterium]|nr:trypsin-like serine protease [Polyangiaceae bacterium]